MQGLFNPEFCVLMIASTGPNPGPTKLRRIRAIGAVPGIESEFPHVEALGADLAPLPGAWPGLSLLTSIALPAGRGRGQSRRTAPVGGRCDRISALSVQHLQRYDYLTLTYLRRTRGLGSPAKTLPNLSTAPNSAPLPVVVPGLPP